MGSRILLIEDEPAISASIAYNLRREGHSVTTAADGALGLDLARQEVPDLVILDVMLPRMDGFEVCRNIRQSAAAELRQVPIIVVTARTDEGDRVIGLDLGADDYVVKPFSMRELASSVLRNRSTRATPSGVKLFSLRFSGSRRLASISVRAWWSISKIQLAKKNVRGGPGGATNRFVNSATNGTPVQSEPVPSEHRKLSAMSAGRGAGLAA